VCVSHGSIDSFAHEGMDRYRGFSWHPDSITLTAESRMPLFRIMRPEIAEFGGKSNHHATPDEDRR
jgi:hypothetical protein